MSEPKYKDVKVKLIGEDGNAFSILGRVRRALKSAGANQAALESFMLEATKGDYDALLQTVMKWVEVE
jgi:hypothetical protein